MKWKFLLAINRCNVDILIIALINMS